MQGSIIKNKGKYYIVIYQGFVNGKKKYKWFGTYDTKKDAAKDKPKIVQQAMDGFYLDDKNMEYGVWLTYYLDEIAKNNVREKTYLGYKSRADVHIIPELGSIKIQDLKPFHIQQFYNKKLKELSPTTVRRIHNIINMSLKHAIKWEMINRNVCEAITPPKNNKYDAETLTIEEIKKVENDLKTDDLYLPFILSINCGFRRGEIAGLEWKNVDLENRIISIRNTLQRVGQEIRMEGVKTDKSNRSVSISGSLVEMLKNQKIKQLENRIKSPQLYVKTDFVCTRCNGTPINPDYYNRRLGRAVENVGIEKHIRFHDLRHTFATLQLEHGENLKVIQEMLGHSSIKTTGDIYLHVKRKTQIEAADRMERILMD